MIDRIDSFEEYYIASPSEAPEAGLVFDSVSITRYETTGRENFRLDFGGKAILVGLEPDSVDKWVEETLRKIEEEEPETEEEREALLREVVEA